MTRRIALDVSKITGVLAEMREIAADFISRSGHDHTAVLLHGEDITEIRVQCREYEGRIQRLESSKPPA